MQIIFKKMFIQVIIAEIISNILENIKRQITNLPVHEVIAAQLNAGSATTLDHPLHTEQNFKLYPKAPSVPASSRRFSEQKAHSAQEHTRS